MKLFVAGGTGFVGKNFIRRAIAAGHTVRCLIRNVYRHETTFDSRVERMKGNILDAASLRPAVQGMDAVINLVGINFEPEGTSFRQIHVTGTSNLITVLQEAGIKRYFHMSSLGASEKATDKYNKTKWEGEELVRKSGLDYTILKPSMVYGPGDSFIAWYGRWVKRLPIIPVAGSGRTRMQPIFVDDLSRIMLECLKKPETIGKVYNIAGPEVVTSTDIVKIVTSIYRKKTFSVPIPRWFMWFSAFLMEKLLPTPLFTREQLKQLHKENLCDISHLKNEIGIEPTSIHKTLRNYIDI